MSDKHVKSFFKNEYKPKKVQSQITNTDAYGLEAFITIKCVPYGNCIYRVSKLSGKYNRDITHQEYQKCKKKIELFSKEQIVSINC